MLARVWRGGGGGGWQAGKRGARMAGGEAEGRWFRERGKFDGGSAGGGGERKGAHGHFSMSVTDGSQG